jgi:hypothetical protein
VTIGLNGINYTQKVIKHFTPREKIAKGEEERETEREREREREKERERERERERVTKRQVQIPI